MVQYSPLCDTSILAYFAYLISSNGEFSFRDSGVGGSGGGGPCGDSGSYVGSDIVRLFLTFCDKNKESEGVLGGACGDPGVVRAFLGDVDVEGERHQDCIARVSGDSYDSDISGVVGSGVDGCGGEHGGGSGAEKLPDDKVSVNGFVRGKNWKRNQKKRAKRAGLRVDGEASYLERNDAADVGPRRDDRRMGVEKSSLRRSLEEKWCAENELKVAKARRELELLKAEDLDAVKKLRERKVQGATERTMVQIEKAHASLVQTGNVPGVRPVQQGFCQTVVDGEVVESVPGLSSGESKECSISPSSSISEREVRNMMKELEDLREENKRYRRKEGLGERVSRMYSESVPVTLDDEGCVPEDIKELAADRFEGHGFFKYGKVFEKDGKKYKTMKFDAEGYSYSGIENWYD